MGNCFNKHKKIPLKIVLSKRLPEKTDDEICKAEIEAFISLEYLDITTSFIKKYSKELIDKKLVQQYYWTLNDNYNDPDLYIPLEDWELRYIWG